MKNVFKLFMLTLISAAFVVACSDDDDSGTTPTETEFVATYADFEGYENWELIATNVGTDPALGTFAHGDTNSTRKIWVNNSDVKMENGEWPVGTILYKQMNNTETGDLIGHMAMAKRGSDFNPENNGWEWFILDVANGEFTDRGSLAGCNGCHGGASSDYSFACIK